MMDHLAGHVVAVVGWPGTRPSLDVVGIGHALDHQVRLGDDVLVGLPLAFLEADLDEVLVELLPERGHTTPGA
jgi:hypothetical protein